MTNQHESTIVEPAGGVSSADLAELMGAFNEVTGKLEATHRSLQSEVARLNAELRDANERLARSKRLAALGEMAAGIAHEIRNPLGSISLYANMLEQDLADRPQELGISRKINSAVRGLDAIVGDVLCFAKEIRPSVDRHDAAELLDRALESSCPEESPMRATLTIVRAYAPGEIEIECDEGLVHQALINVIRNALEAASEQSPNSPRIALSAVVREGAEVEKEIVLGVRDEGAGVSDEVVQRMFNPFFTTRAVGTGLGLPIVHRIVDAHGGRVDVGNNADGPGANVELVFPVTKAREGTQKQSSATDRPGIREQEAFV